MSDNNFVDSNVLLYLFSDEQQKRNRAKQILLSSPIISTQVLSENVNVLSKKFKHVTLEQIALHIKMLKTCCQVTSVSLEVIEKALEIKKRYGFQWYDCTIISSAVLNNCTTLFSEDMQHNMRIDNNLLIINPFI